MRKCSENLMCLINATSAKLATIAEATTTTTITTTTTTTSRNKSQQLQDI